MAKLKDAKPKNTSGSYTRIFDNKKLGELITKIQSTAISNGAELEKIIINICKDNGYLIDDFDEFLSNHNIPNELTRVVPKKAIKKSNTLKNDGKYVNFEPDFVVLKIDVKNKNCYIIELKDGFEFDTKKVIGEREHLEKFADAIARKIPYTIHIRFCCFNEEDKNKIRTGLKNAFELNEIMTGKEFCNLIDIDYDSIVQIRRNDAKENFDFFIEQLISIDEVKNKINNLNK